ncbi:MAG TPA: hypothetical protein VLA48_10440 [Nitrososphaeraceae archaeon]|nr:hypothetical protein [Nitrososphaeraceae archaeon]
MNKSKKHDIRTIIHIPDDRWNEIRNILSEKNLEMIIEHPLIP